MKVVLLSGASSVHTLQWANGLNSLGVDVHIISQHEPISGYVDGISIYKMRGFGPLGYFAMIEPVKRILNTIKPDIVNAHYASGYGTTARLVNSRPWLMSVWGSDVYNFPYKSVIHKSIVLKNLLSADAVASTSHCMANKIQELAPTLTEIDITPFGVDCEKFTPNLNPKISDLAVHKDSPVVIGTVKSLTPTYGIDILIKAFSLARRRLMNADSILALRLKLRIVGGGEDAMKLRKLAYQVGIADVTEFVGSVPHDQVPEELNKFDIYVALSRQESFGVAALEAGAMGLPAIVSDAGGLPEVVLHRHTGLVVPKEDVHAASNALLLLINNSPLRAQLGSNARLHVLNNYSWNYCCNNMIGLYERVIRGKNNHIYI